LAAAASAAALVAKLLRLGGAEVEGWEGGVGRSDLAQLLCEYQAAFEGPLKVAACVAAAGGAPGLSGEPLFLALFDAVAGASDQAEAIQAVAPSDIAAFFLRHSARVLGFAPPVDAATDAATADQLKNGPNAVFAPVAAPASNAAAAAGAAAPPEARARATHSPSSDSQSSGSEGSRGKGSRGKAAHPPSAQDASPVSASAASAASAASSESAATSKSAAASQTPPAPRLERPSEPLPEPRGADARRHPVQQASGSAPASVPVPTSASDPSPPAASPAVAEAWKEGFLAAQRQSAPPPPPLPVPVPAPQTAVQPTPAPEPPAEVTAFAGGPAKALGALSVAEVTALLWALGLGSYGAAVAGHGTDGALLALAEQPEELRDLGVDVAVKRKKLAHAVAALRTSGMRTTPLTARSHRLGSWPLPLP